MNIKSVLSVGMCAAALSLSPLARATIVSLDFETPATGSQLDSAPLVTAAGTVTLSATGAVAITNNGGPTIGIFHTQTDDADRALLSFGFDVDSITFDFNGAGTGDFLAEALDNNGAVVDSYSFFGTSCVNCFDGVNIVLAASGIRSFRFADPFTIERFSFVDNVRLSTSVSVPEPGTVALLGLGLAGFAASRRRKQ